MKNLLLPVGIALFLIASFGCRRINSMSEFVITDEVNFFLDSNNTQKDSVWTLQSTSIVPEYEDKLDFHQVDGSKVELVTVKSFEILVRDKKDLGFMDSLAVWLRSDGLDDVLIATTSFITASEGIVLNGNEVPNLEPYFKADSMSFVIQGFSKRVITDSIPMRLFLTTIVDHKGI